MLDLRNLMRKQDANFDSLNKTGLLMIPAEFADRIDDLIHGYISHTITFWKKAENIPIDTFCFGNNIEHSDPNLTAVGSSSETASNNLHINVGIAA